MRWWLYVAVHVDGCGCALKAARGCVCVLVAVHVVGVRWWLHTAVCALRATRGLVYVTFTYNLRLFVRLCICAAL